MGRKKYERVHKYRAWDEEKSRMSKPFSLGSQILVWETDIEDTFMPVEFFIRKQRGIIMQYVEIEDKNGIEIYEDYIVKHTDANGEKIGAVEWMNELNAFRIVFSKDSYYFIQDIDEVIGNKHENPELLELLDNKGNKDEN